MTLTWPNKTRQLLKDKHNMNPSSLITWALCLGVAWLILASLTGVDEWLRSRFGTSKRIDLEDRLKKLENRLEELEKKERA